jgi:hypothetical protein
METAKLLSSGFDREDLHSGEIIRLPNVSEIWDEIEFEGRKSPNAKADRYVASGGTTTVTVSDGNARFLNEKFRDIGFPIKVSASEDAFIRSGCGGERCAIKTTDFSEASSENSKFLKNVLPILRDDAVNLIVGHGWYIREIVRNSNKAPNITKATVIDLDKGLYNTQGVLFEYNMDDDKPTMLSVMGYSTGHEGGVPDSLKTLIAENDKFVTCKYEENEMSGLPPCDGCSRDRAQTQVRSRRPARPRNPSPRKLPKPSPRKTSASPRKPKPSPRKTSASPRKPKPSPRKTSASPRKPKPSPRKTSASPRKPKLPSKLVKASARKPARRPAKR